MSEQVKENKYWKPEPKEPWHDWRTYSMLGPIACGAVGACIFFALGLAFAEIANIRADVRKPLIFVASFGVAIGAVFGSIGSGIEIFRKVYKGQVKFWDWVSLGISTVTTIAGMITGVATLLGGTTTWSQGAVIWGSAAVCGFAALDAAGDGIEVGGLFGSYEDRVELWRSEREAWRVQNGQSVVFDRDKMDREIQTLNAKLAAVTEHIMEVEDRWTWPTATIADFKPILEGMNGGAATLDREILAMKLAHDKLNPPSSSTVDRWLKMASVG